MGGNRSRVIGYRYNFSFGGLICHGPVAKLHKITNQDTVIYEGPLAYSAASFNADGSTTVTTDLGDIYFYWGTVANGSNPQTANAGLAAFNVNMTDGTSQAINAGAMKGICYFVTDSGFEQGNSTAPPNLKFEVERYPCNQNDPDTPLFGAATANVASTGDVYIPEVIYDLLTNTRYGLGLTNVDSTSFIAAQDQLVAEESDGLYYYVSPIFDKSENLRQAIGELLNICDGFLRENASGEIELILNRPHLASSALTLDTSNILEEPEIDNSYQSELWTYTLINYNNRDLEYQDDSSSFDDQGSSSYLGDIVREFNVDAIREEEVANTMAIRKGMASAIPHTVVDVICHPSVGRQLNQGDFVTLDYAPLAYNALFRVVQVTLGGPLNFESRLKLISVRSQQDPANVVNLALQAAVRDPVIKDTTDPTKGFTVTDLKPHIAALPELFRDFVHQDGFVAAGATDQYSLLNSVTYTQGASPLQNQAPQTITNTPARGTIQWYEILSNERVTLCVAWDDISSGNSGLEQKNRFSSIIEGVGASEEVYAMTCKRRIDPVSGINEHLTESIWFRLNDVNEGIQIFQSASGRWMSIFECDMKTFGNEEYISSDLEEGGGNTIASTVYVGTLNHFATTRYMKETFTSSTRSSLPIGTFYVFYEITTIDGVTHSFAPADADRPMVWLNNAYYRQSALGATNVDIYPVGRFGTTVKWLPSHPGSFVTINLSLMTDPDDYRDWGSSPEPYLDTTAKSTTLAIFGQYEAHYGLANAETASRVRPDLGDQAIGWQMHNKRSTDLIDGSSDNNPFILEGLNSQYGYATATHYNGGFTAPYQELATGYTAYKL